MKQVIFITILIAVLFSSCKEDTEYSNQKELISFIFEELTPKVTATIDETNRTITAEVPFDTDIRTLIPSIIISSDAHVSPESGKLTDFNSPVIYTVIAEDGTTKEYVLTIILGANSEKIISSFIFKGLNPKITATIDETSGSITAYLPVGTDIKVLTPSLVISHNATISPANGMTTDFTEPVTYILTAEDGTKKEYVVSIYIPFTSIWNTKSEGRVIELPLHDDGVYNFTVNWGDDSSPDNITTWDSAEKSHTYAAAGDHTITITGRIEGFSFYVNDHTNGTSKAIIDVTNWGTEFRFGNKGNYFLDCTNLTGFTATDIPNLTGTTNMEGMFKYASVFNQDISNWNVSAVINMNYMFYSAAIFNGDISNWDVSAVTDMSYMFYYASAFNRDISTWDVSAVTNMSNTFRYASIFNQDLSDWNVLAVTDMSYMFYEAKKFNQGLSIWNVSAVTNMSDMFRNANAFNGDISDWNVSSVTNMYEMFFGANAFNQDLKTWNVSAVTNMRGTFRYTNVFNGDISSWNVSAVTNMRDMFAYASLFNQDLSNWNVSSVTSIYNFDTGTTAWTNSAWKPSFNN